MGYQGRLAILAHQFERVVASFRMEIDLPADPVFRVLLFDHFPRVSVSTIFDSAVLVD